MKTRLINYRTGFASNSSSTHSIYIVKDSKKVKNTVEDSFFGWDEFIASSKEELINYIGSQIKNNISTQVPEYVKNAVMQSIFKNVRNCNFDCYIDHQSGWLIPPYVNESMDFPSIDLVKDIKDHILDNNHIIVGGNDNTETDIDKIIETNYGGKIDKNFEIISKSGMSRSNCVCMKDGNVWKIFNTETGEKLRFSFDRNFKSYDKSSVPELVDLIITNKCDRDCSFCYRGCTSEGTPAKFGDVCDYIDTLIDMNVLEIVIGGGDILKYEYVQELMNIIDSIKYDRKKTTVFNTTISLPYYFGMRKGWLKEANRISSIDEKKLERILDTFSGVAFSITSITDIYKVITFLGGSKAKTSLQCIPEIFASHEHLIDVVETASKFGLPITFLGLKETGRAKNNKYYQTLRDNIRKTFNVWFPQISSYYYNIGVDTQFIKNFPQVRSDEHEWTITPEEGKFSCCIDATDNTISASSYHPDKKIILRENNDVYNNELKNQIEKYYKEF